MRKIIQKHFGTFVGLLILLIASVVVLFPILWMFKTSISPFQEIFTDPARLVPSTADFSAYASLLQRVPIFRWFWNTFLVSSLATLLVLCITVPAAYILARQTFRSRKLIQLVITACNSIPKAALFIPYLMVSMARGLFNTHIALVVVYVAMLAPFAAIILTSYFATIPASLEEAAMIDGCSIQSAIIWVVLPVSVPGVLSVGIYCFINAWTEYFYSLVLTSSDDMRTLTVGLVTFFDQAGFIQDFTQVSAGAIVSILPVILVFLLLQKFFVQGMVAGAVKM